MKKELEGKKFVILLRIYGRASSFLAFLRLGLILWLSPAFAEKQTVCLNMIVKDESQVIERCLRSVKRMIDYWVIVDTGSTDGTQKIIREFMKDLPGELHERPWVNFAHNRNEAIQFAKGKGDYLLFIDADEEFTYKEPFIRPLLTSDSYCIMCDLDGHLYRRKLIVNNHMNWKWKGVIHELLDCPEAAISGNIAGIVNVIRMEGNRSRDPDKYKKDVKLLEKEVQIDPSLFNLYFLAQSYRDAGDYESAIKTFRQCISLEKTAREATFWCYYQIGLLQDVLKKDFQTVLKGYCNAFHFDPERAEPLCELARFFNNQGLSLIAYHVSKFALKIPRPKEEGCLIYNKSVYDHSLLMELTRAAYWLQKYPEAYETTIKVLNQKDLPETVRNLAQGNLEAISAQLNPN